MTMIAQLPFPQSTAGAVAFGLAAGAGLAAANLVASRAGQKHPPRWAYALFVVMPFGILLPAWALGALRARAIVGDVVAATPWPIAAGLAAGFALMALAARRNPQLPWKLAPRMWVA